MAATFAQARAERRADRPWHPGRVCTVRRVLDAMSPEDADALREALADEDDTHAGIAADLRQAGHRVSTVTVGRHRRGECRC